MPQAVERWPVSTTLMAPGTWCQVPDNLHCEQSEAISRRWATTPLARDCFVAPPLAISAARRAPRWSAKRSRSPRSGRDPVLNRNNFYAPGMRRRSQQDAKAASGPTHFGTHSEGPVSGARWWTTADEDTAASKAEAALGEQRNTARGILASARSLSPANSGFRTEQPSSPAPRFDPQRSLVRTRGSGLAWWADLQQS
jgi:hypothetical protein